MLAWILEKLAWDGIKTAFLSWWNRRGQEEAINEAIAPFKAEAEALAKPAGTDDDVIKRL